MFKKFTSVLLAFLLAFLCTSNAFAAALYYPACSYDGESIVNALDSIGVESSYAHREVIAQANGISDYHGTASQNKRLLNLAKAGKLRDAEGGVQGESVSILSPQTDVYSATLLSGAQEPARDMVQVVNSCQLHEEPYAKADAVTAVAPGDCFEVLAETLNDYSNLWYEVSWAGKIAYIFSGHVTKHTHDFHVVVDEKLSVCRCGAVSTTKGGAAQLVSLGGEATLTASLPVAAAALASLGCDITVAVGAAFPLVAVVTVGGLVIYMAVSASATQVDVESVQLATKDDCMSLMEKQSAGDGAYYKACTIPNSGALLIYPQSMDIFEANRFLKWIVQSPTSIKASNETNTPIASVWCMEERDARSLCEKWSKNRMGDYSYGSSRDYDSYYEIDLDASGGPKEGYFQHYHLWYRPYLLNWLMKVKETHVFFGLPYVNVA